MAVQIQAVIDEVRAETGEISPDRMTDLLLLGWINDDTIGVFLQFIDIFQERYITSIDSATITWDASAAGKWAAFSVASPFFKTMQVASGDSTTTMPSLAIPLTLAQFYGFNGNANYAGKLGWIQLSETAFRLVKGGTVTEPATVRVFGVRKPLLPATIGTNTVDLPDEFIPLVKSKVKIRSFDILGRVEKVQIEMGKLAERVQGIEQSYRSVVEQTGEGHRTRVGQS